MFSASDECYSLSVLNFHLVIIHVTFDCLYFMNFSTLCDIELNRISIQCKFKKSIRGTLVYGINCKSICTAVSVTLKCDEIVLFSRDEDICDSFPMVIKLQYQLLFNNPEFRPSKICKNVLFKNH